VRRCLLRPVRPLPFATFIIDNYPFISVESLPMCRISSVVCVASSLIALLSISVPARAQTTASGSIHGVATDQDGAVVPGVLVSATSVTVPGVYSTTTDSVGQYRLENLPPGDYTLVAELSGFARFVRKAITIQTGLNGDVNIPMKVGGVDETVEVHQDTPLLETRNATQSVNISGELLRGTPLTEKREWFGALSLVPGVSTALFAGLPQIYVHGSDPSANVVQIDGANVDTSTNAGVTYLSLNTDIVDDMQIKTSGVDASSPLGIGGIVNIATTSGTNRVKGGAAVAFEPRQWNSSNTPGGTSSTVEQRQVDLSLGGPVVKDHLWAFAAYRYANTRSGVSRTAAQIATLQSLVKGFKPFDSISTAHFPFAKITSQISAAHQLSGFFERDANPVETVIATAAHPSAQATGGAAAAARLSSVWSDRLTTRLGVSYNNKRRAGQPTGVDGPFQRVYQSTILSGGRLTGNGQLATLQSPTNALVTQPNSKLIASFDTSLFARRGSSTHELEAGVYAERRVGGNDINWINGGFVTEDTVLAANGVVPFHRQIVDGTQLTSYRQRGQDYAAYVQDAWRPTTQLTVNAGVRVDKIIMQDLVFNVRSQNSTEIGPRLGVNYALTADAKNVARAHWVLVGDQPGLVATIGSAALGTHDLYDLNLDGTFETEFFAPATVKVTPNQHIDPNLHQPSVNEWGAGYGRQFNGGVTTGLDYLHRRFVDRPTLVETNGLYSGDVFTGYKDPAFNEIYLGTNNHWNTPVYDSLEVSVTKRTNRVQAIASYVRQWRHIDGTWQPNDPASFIQPNAFANDAGIGSTTGSASSPVDTNSLSGTGMTEAGAGAAQWQDHAIRAGVTWIGPWALLVAANYTLQSGIYSGPIVTRLAAPDPTFGPATVTLSNGRVVSNPLATVIRFAYPTRGDGQLTTPAFDALNLRVGRRFAFTRAKFDASLDIFNLTNHGADMFFQSGGNQTYNVLFGTTSFRQLPRSAQILLRTSF
jgi:hypothetical protein